MFALQLFIDGAGRSTEQGVKYADIHRAEV
jgi:hypothetical protein